MSEEIKGPGILYVEARIARPDLMDEDTYMNWYDNDHIAEIVATSGVDSAFRYIRRGVDWPYLAMYEMRDVAFTQGDEFRRIRVHSDLLPGSKLIYDLADNNVRYYRLLQVYDPTKKGPGHTKTLISAQIELKDGYPVEDFDAWYRKEHLDQLSKAPGYLRTTRFKLVFSRSNAQSRALKGLPVTSNEPVPNPPTWLALHEFATEDVDLGQLKDLTDTAWTRKIEQNSERRDYPIYKIAKTHGKGEWFHAFP
ncbi:Dimeric alpha-beta barrel [Niveomyces insectorum RCEF 264]|uniref:Dimeric alpha-beta barrel n=1 Tax=Niveomyces insectorum RCEF 264 TaxID=1081102 RepID=A0A167Q8K2_9HYPO|nr:Dimeric alpha-beta barrel [Niveomyces insectorum RCEF 264]